MNTQTNSGRRPRTNPSSTGTAINSRIRLGTTSASGQKRAMTISLFAVAPIFAWVLMVFAVRDCKDSLVMEIANRLSIEDSIQCRVFNKECNCRISPNETLSLDRCLSPLQLFAMRIIPVVSSVLQLFAFREYVTFGTAGNRLSNPVAWVMSPLVSIGITVGMFSTHCHNLHLGLSIFSNGSLLAMLVFYDRTKNPMVAENEGRRLNANRLNPPIEPADNEGNTRNEIL